MRSGCGHMHRVYKRLLGERANRNEVRGQDRDFISNAARTESLRAAAAGSPSPASARTASETYRSNQSKTWRIFYRVDGDAIVIAEVFAKSTQATPKHVLVTSQRRLRLYDKISEGER